MVRPERFELPTPSFVAKYSIQMSYGRLRGPNYTQESGEDKIEATRRRRDSGYRQPLPRVIFFVLHGCAGPGP